MLPFIYIAGHPVAMYGLCIATGIFAASLFARFLVKKSELSFDDFIIYAAVMFGMGFLGAKLFYIFINCPFSEWKNQFLYLVSDREKAASGFVFYGGLIAGFAGLFVAKAVTGVKILNMAPVFAVIMPLVHCFGRLGCFCAGCCYGINYEGFCSVVYKNPVSSVKAGIGIFPVQLLESALLLILFALLLIEYLVKLKTQKSLNVLIIKYVMCYSVIRFVLEFLRGDIERGRILIFSTSQFISFVVFIISVIGYVIINRHCFQPLERTSDFC